MSHHKKPGARPPMSTPSPTSKGRGGGGGTPSSSSSNSSKKRGGKDEGLTPVDTLEAALRLSRTEAAAASSPSAPLDRLLLSPQDMRRLGLRAGDWVAVTANADAASDPAAPEHDGPSTPVISKEAGNKAGMAVMRAWPAAGMALPAGMVLGASPVLFGQFPPSSASASTSSLRPVLLRSSVPPIDAPAAQVRIVPIQADGGGCNATQQQQFWAARLKDVLLGQVVFPGLRLVFESFGAHVVFEVQAARGTSSSGSGPSNDEEGDGGLGLQLSALSLDGDGGGGGDGGRGRLPLRLFLVHRDTEVDVREAAAAATKGEGGVASDVQGPDAGADANPWAGVGGLDSAIQEVVGCVEQALEAPEVFARHGLKPTRGVLLVGPSGSGKTTLLRAAGRFFARTKGYHVMSLSGPEVVGRLVGETEANLRRAFAEARARAPTVLLLDEVEALCGRREAASSDLDRRMVSTLLALMDGFQGLERVVVLAATSRPQAIDPAVRRPGRLDREVDIGVPGEAARREILRVLLRQAAGTAAQGLGEGDVAAVATRAHGFVGADLLLVCKEAAMRALRRRRQRPAQDEEGEEEGLQLTREDLLAGLRRVRPSALREVAVEVPRVRWSDIGGQDEVKRGLRECVEWPLTRPEAFARMGIAPPKGVLLYGPPGCSKTLMARALATESGMNFLAVKGPELLSKWLGESEKALQSLFKKARAAAPTVIFFDEVDALAGRRGAGEDSKASERVLSQLLTELDGVQPLRRVVVVAATNRPDLLDPALMRPGRIDRKVYVPPPDLPSRREILAIALRGVPVGGDVDLDEVARRTEGFSGAEVVALCREASLAAIEEDPEHASSLGARHLHKALAGWKRRITPEMLAFYRRFAAGGRRGGGEEEEVPLVAS